MLSLIAMSWISRNGFIILQAKQLLNTFHLSKYDVTAVRLCTIKDEEHNSVHSVQQYVIISRHNVEAAAEHVVHV